MSEPIYIDNNYIIVPQLDRDGKDAISMDEIISVVSQVAEVKILSTLDSIVKMVLVECSKEKAAELLVVLGDRCYIEQEQLIGFDQRNNQ